MQSLEEMYITDPQGAVQAGPAMSWMLIVSIASQRFDFGF